ncbi:hypothetical protein ABM90_10465 [Rhodococcus erythropolis]|nr:hypothetical protein ABM90_10465 [Rhodococcus erythropolis]
MKMSSLTARATAGRALHRALCGRYYLQSLYQGRATALMDEAAESLTAMSRYYSTFSEDPAHVDCPCMTTDPK